ncbi:bifunctional farnesyl-diphosphate farnesyltransferase/squalene synthase [Lodderomyces elongisporus]|uniref:bifunctional farnesyl-diphosphate farnesyltransferase/squalene synthase n=1 Tax=Lodderomyces elongisporus TaxID=36914 RepID=UPI0029235E73|nr:bifunctional farnesyl-diphosphate farnesyltransferase/squalene synthase [Lodderomyces elongisporus]WLF79517.1 bifunctional farnesyl-diphosphate farnesyltransferase/squalene synthase [Lodderomyces elongisporus]
MGKVVQLLTHPTELLAAIKFFGFRQSLHSSTSSQANSDELKRCYELLHLTSRSFAAVIEELHPELRDAIMIFYLVLRALDTVEDDMTIDPETKIPLLRHFDEKLDTKNWTFNGSGPNEKDRAVLVEFDVILKIYHELKPQYQEIIKDITYKMGNGMADYILDENFNLNGVGSVEDYDLYCHYVAGLVGEGLTKLMVLAKFSDKSLAEDKFVKSNSMGLFLQKTNIIRDYHEDLQDGRSFWPKDIWSKYTDSLPSFHKDASHEDKGLACINELVLNALGHVKHVLEFLSLVKDPSTFSFCAIPQVMAIATLAEVYNNPKVLHGVVKIRKGTTCKLILESRTFPGVVRIFRKYIQVINHKSSVRDPNYLKIGIKCGEIEQFCESLYPSLHALPKGAKLPEGRLTKALKSRKEIDESVQKIIDQENFNANFVFGFVAVLFIGLILFITGYKL